MFRPRPLVVGATIAAFAAVAAGAVWFWTRDAGQSAVRLHVIQRLDRPTAVSPFDPVRGAASARLRWTAADIERHWTRLGAGASRTYRSPQIGLAQGGVFAIVATLPRANDHAALLLWSAGQTLTPEDFARNRRDLRSAGGAPLVLRADNLQPDARAIQYLFVHLPPGAPIGEALETLAVVERSDLTKGSAMGPVRLTEGGETREVVLAPLNQRVLYDIDAPRGVVSIGLHLAPQMQAEVRVWQRTASSETALFNGEVRDTGWHDLSAQLAHDGPSTIAVEAIAAGMTGTVSWSTPALLAKDQDTSQPNIILYVVDALRADALGLYGSRDGLSPVIDSMGREALLFTRAYAAASWTKPSVTTLLTSLYPATHRLGARFYSDPLPSTVMTLQDALAGSGYLTAQFSANPFTGTLSNLDQGFDVTLTPQGLRREATNAAAPIRAADVHERTLRWLASQRGRRVFAYVQPVDTHPPFSVRGPTPRASYEASLAALDAELGRFRQQLAALGFGDNTLFVLTADHGETFGEHGNKGHGQSVYDEEVRVPLLFHWPGRIAPGRVDEPVHHVDVTPTILAVAGTTATDSSFQGRSLWPRDPTWRPSPVVMTRFVYPEDDERPASDQIEMHAIVDYPWKLIVSTSGSPSRVELYRLDTDPRELHDLASSDPQRVKALAAALDQFAADQGRRRTRFAAEHAGGGAPPALPPSRDLLDQLRSLGYVR